MAYKREIKEKLKVGFKSRRGQPTCATVQVHFMIFKVL